MLEAQLTIGVAGLFVAVVGGAIIGIGTILQKRAAQGHGVGGLRLA